MSKIKVAELFYSVQGEGRFVGVPSIFLRTFGCNFTCSGFGCAPGVLSTDADEIAKNIQLYSSLEQLPLVKTGCDSYASWHPSFKHLSPMLEVDDVVNAILQLTPNNKWVQDNGNDVHLIITGGEPLLGWQRAYSELLDHPKMADLKNITFETNGTQLLTTEFKQYLLARDVNSLRGKHSDVSITFSVSAKLSASGEKWEDAICPDVVASYQTYGHTYLKFVVETKEHINEAKRAVDAYRAAGFTGQVYLMPQGGTLDPYNANTKFIVNECLREGWYFSPRLHISLFGNSWGT
jgi:organic radical activating enzyme